MSTDKVTLTLNEMEAAILADALRRHANACDATGDMDYADISVQLLDVVQRERNGAGW